MYNGINKVGNRIAKGNKHVKEELTIYLAWCIMGDDSEHGHVVIAHDQDEARSIVMRAWQNIKAATISEATETTKQWKNSLNEMYEKQNALLGV